MFVPNRHPTKEYWANTWLNNVGIEHYIRFIMALPYSTTKSPRLRYPVVVDNNDSLPSQILAEGRHRRQGGNTRAARGQGSDFSRPLPPPSSEILRRAGLVGFGLNCAAAKSAALASS